MAKRFAEKSEAMNGRTEPRERVKVVKESYNKTMTFVLRESTIKDLNDIVNYEGYKSRNALVNEILEKYIDDYYSKKK